MGFSIGRLLGGLAPIVGGIFGGAPGAALGAAVGAAFAPGSSSPSSVGPTVQAALPAVIAPTIARTVIGALATAGSIVAGYLLTASNNTGRRVTRQQVSDAVRVCGIAQAAAMFGLSEGQICTIVIAKRRRRSRGISAADLRRTRSTIRKVHNISHDLRALVPRVRAHHK